MIEKRPRRAAHHRTLATPRSYPMPTAARCRAAHILAGLSSPRMPRLAQATVPARLVLLAQPPCPSGGLHIAPLLPAFLCHLCGWCCSIIHLIEPMATPRRRGFFRPQPSALLPLPDSRLLRVGFVKLPRYLVAHPLLEQAYSRSHPLLSRKPAQSLQLYNDDALYVALSQERNPRGAAVGSAARIMGTR